jgi:hypothetical protein
MMKILCACIGFLGAGFIAVGLAIANEPITSPQSVGTAQESKVALDCPGLRDPVDKKTSPLRIIAAGAVPGAKKSEANPSANQVKCVESLRTAGKKAIEKKKPAEGVARYMAAVQLAPSLAETTYQELANALDRNAYTEPALAAYFKAWSAIEANYQASDAKLDSTAVLVLAGIRDSIVRLGGVAPTPTTEVGRLVLASSTRRLREEYFNAEPLASPRKP